jgi:hypothetical protein
MKKFSFHRKKKISMPPSLDVKKAVKGDADVAQLAPTEASPIQMHKRMAGIG